MVIEIFSCSPRLYVLKILRNSLVAQEKSGLRQVVRRDNLPGSMSHAMLNPRPHPHQELIGYSGIHIKRVPAGINVIDIFLYHNRINNEVDLPAAT